MYTFSRTAMVLLESLRNIKGIDPCRPGMAACSRDAVRGMHGTRSSTRSTADQDTREQGKTV